MALLHPKALRAAPAGVALPESFFEEILPRILFLRREQCRRLGGRYGFRVNGSDGGEWTLDYVQGRVQRGCAADLPFCITLDASAFGDMLAGSLDVTSAYESGRIRITGNPDLLQNVVAILVG